jgi:NitT/TauT family transport system substrate-binding protein
VRNKSGWQMRLILQQASFARFRRRMSVGALAFLILGLSCGEPSPGPLRIGYSPFPGHGFLSLAEQKGFFREEGVAVELREFSSFSAAVHAYEADRLDALASSVSGLLQIAQRMRTVRGIALLAYSEGAEGLIAQPEITTLQALRGKRIGLSLWGVGGYLWARLRERSGLRDEDLVLLNLSPQDGQRAFLRREIDAWLTFEPWLTLTLRQTRANLLFTSRELPGEIADVFSVQERVLRQRREDVRRVLRAYFRAVAYGRAHPEETTRFFAERAHSSIEEATAMLEHIRFLDREENRRALGTPEGRAALERIIEHHRRVGMIREMVDLTHLFDLAVIQEVP